MLENWNDGNAHFSVHFTDSIIPLLHPFESGNFFLRSADGSGQRLLCRIRAVHGWHVTGYATKPAQRPEAGVAT